MGGVCVSVGVVDLCMREREREREGVGYTGPFCFFAIPELYILP